MAKTKKAPAVAIDHRKQSSRRDKSERREANAQVVAERRIGQRREKVNRRRQIDPTTCERDYTDDEVEFMNAIDDYKRNSGRMFPTCSEVLEVLRGLGYQKVSAAQSATVEEPRPAIALAEETADWTLEAAADMPL